MAGYLSPILVTLLVGLEDLVPSDFPEFNVKLFWNRDLFDDSFFTQPIGSSSFGSSTGFSFQLGIHPSGFLQHLVLGCIHLGLFDINSRGCIHLGSLTIKLQSLEDTGDQSFRD